MMMESTKGLGQRDIEGDTNDCFIFDSWFSSKDFSEDAIDVGADIIGMIKPTKNYFKGYH